MTESVLDSASKQKARIQWSSCILLCQGILSGFTDLGSTLTVAAVDKTFDPRCPPA